MGFSGKNTGVGCHFLLHGIFMIQGLNPQLLCLLHYRPVLYRGTTGEAQRERRKKRWWKQAMPLLSGWCFLHECPLYVPYHLCILSATHYVSLCFARKPDLWEQPQPLIGEVVDRYPSFLTSLSESFWGSFHTDFQSSSVALSSRWPQQKLAQCHTLCCLHFHLSVYLKWTDKPCGLQSMGSQRVRRNRKSLPSPMAQMDHSCDEEFTRLKLQVSVTQSCLTLGKPMSCNLLGSSVHGILQERILEWVPISFSRRSSQTRDWTPVFHIAGRFFTICSTRETHLKLSGVY